MAHQGKKFPWRTILIPIPEFEGYSIKEDGSVFSHKNGRFLKHHLNENGYLYATLRKENRNRTVAVHRLVAAAYLPNPDQKPFVNHLDANRTNPHKDNLEWCTQAENIKHAYKIGNMSQKQNFSQEELDKLLDRFEAGETMTGLASEMAVGLSRMTINLRNRAHKTSRFAAFEAELKRQKQLRNTEANVTKRTPVVQLSLSGGFIAGFPSITAAAKALGVSSSGPIHNALNPNNIQKSAYGFLWKYA